MNLEHIDTSTTAGKAEVMRLAAEGRRAVWRVKGDGQWRNSPVEWNWTDHQYAIIAEPVGPEEVWVVVGIDDGIFTKEGAEEMASRCPGTTIARYLRADLAGEVKP